MVTVYVLKLTNNKYYVGKTDKPINECYKEHLNGTGSLWTCIYKPIKISDTISNADINDEDKYTKMYMDKYGIDNVRGGTYDSIMLSDEQIKLLQSEFCIKKKKCFKCLRFGHYSNNCREKNDIYDNIINYTI